MSDKICIFAGTTEGRRLAELLKNAAETTVCVATEYGEVMLDGIDGITVFSGRMDDGEMTAFFEEKRFDRIIDATHPYARTVTENIAAAAKAADIPLMRILREKDRPVEGAVYVSSVSEARDFLCGTEGNIFITTGSKELSSYIGLDMSRVWARVLPVASSLQACAEAGVLSPHVIAAQGPFPEEMNLAQLKMIEARYLVTKDSGKNGGFDEKIKAAKAAGATPVIVGRPPQTDGLSPDEAIRELQKSYRIGKREIFVIGIGPGGESVLTPEAKKALNECDAVFGASSVIAALGAGKPRVSEYLPKKVRAALEERPSVRRAAVVFRGDTGFFSGAANMIKEFDTETVRVIPGVSSLSAFAAKLGVSWDGAAWISLHGRDGNLISAVRRNKKLFVLTGGENTPASVCERLTEYGFGELTAVVGERLYYQDEKITKGAASLLCKNGYDPLSIVYIENPGAEETVPYGIGDGEFERGDTPMTKSEVRAVSMAKLSVGPDSVVWDVGAGTGSVSVECALAAYRGAVYAIEKEADAVGLVEKNKLKFKTDNLTVIHGAAPDVFSDLPAPTHAFIGGSGGKLRGILDALLEKNPFVRIVMNTVTLESQTEAFMCAKEYGFDIFEAAAVNISRSKKAGPYHMMSAQNPVTVFVMQKRKSE